jgi:hypothetical protein
MKHANRLASASDGSIVMLGAGQSGLSVDSEIVVAVSKFQLSTTSAKRSSDAGRESAGMH